MVSENGELGQNRAQPFCLGHSDFFFFIILFSILREAVMFLLAQQMMRCNLDCTLLQAWLAKVTY